MEVAAELQEIQKEISAIKKCLPNGAYLGMTGETLQRYFLNLNEKENLLLSRQLQLAAPSSNLLGDSKKGYPSVATVAPTSSIAQADEAPAKALPDGTPAPFDRDNLASVCAHMCQYEASPSESGKALRALASIAYTNAEAAGEHPDVLPQLLRLLNLHPSDDNVQVNALRALCNIAYDQSVAAKKLASTQVMNAIVQAVVRKSESKEVAAKASEAVARVVSVEVNPDAPKPEVKALETLFSSSGTEQATRDVVVQLVEQLISNEVATPDVLAQKLVAAAKAAEETGPKAAAWLQLAKALALKEIANLSDCLIARGAILAAHSIIKSQVPHGPTQLAGIESLSGLVGARYIGLQAFAGVRGMDCVETAMSEHPMEAVLQTKGTRALASGVMWEQDIQMKAGWNLERSVGYTKRAMATHTENEELQIAGLEALQKYLDKTNCSELIKADGGVEIVQAAMSSHSGKKVQTLGKAVLDLLPR
jgi:hypothetical protein